MSSTIFIRWQISKVVAVNPFKPFLYWENKTFVTLSNESINSLMLKTYMYLCTNTWTFATTIIRKTHNNFYHFVSSTFLCYKFSKSFLDKMREVSVQKFNITAKNLMLANQPNRKTGVSDCVFCLFFGTSPRTGASLWKICNFPNKTWPKYLMWALIFLKLYE